MQSDRERLTPEMVKAERRCQLLEDLLDHLDAHIPEDDEE
jgi:hypothetical protein